jgi:hypothetical protein
MNELLTKADLALIFETFQSKLTIRLGSIIAASIVVLAILLCIQRTTLCARHALAPPVIWADGFALLIGHPLHHHFQV